MTKDDIFASRVSWIYQCLNALCQLVHSVWTENGWMVDDKAAEYYSRLRDTILAYSGELAEDDPTIEQLDILLRFNSPDYLFSTITASEISIDVFGIDEFATTPWFPSAPSFFEEQLAAVKGLLEDFGQTPIELENDDKKLVSETLAYLPILLTRRQRLIENFQQDVDRVVEKFQIDEFDANRKLSFIEETPTRMALVDYVDELFTAYRCGIYRSCFLLGVSVIQGTLVYGLGKRGDEAKMDYVDLAWENEKFLRLRNTIQHNCPPPIDRWDIPTILEIATSFGDGKAMIDEQTRKHCHEVNHFRNSYAHQVVGAKHAVGPPTKERSLFVLATLGELFDDVDAYFRE